MDRAPADPHGDVPVRLARQSYALQLLGENQSFGSGVAGSSGSRAPGMSFHRKFWKVRTRAVSMGYLL
ncbi:hypothetical protein GCM10025872_37400 [Barrientosiimonas endolithica]|uniref:Uncharacterized protein n=1 Tax=Barrientosiimonas endolithica TaxID=1535208 RepID=A0ABN6YZ13_9MICO|nr:hypothetical protein GCM10025872_37400 [Barrientosiimonas endolithica]